MADHARLAVALGATVGEVRAAEFRARRRLWSVKRRARNGPYADHLARISRMHGRYTRRT